jgi:hypothetical protein
MDERPDHAMVDAQTPVSQLGDQRDRGEVALPAAPQEPVPMLTDQLFRPMASFGRAPRCRSGDIG